MRIRFSLFKQFDFQFSLFVYLYLSDCKCWTNWEREKKQWNTFSVLNCGEWRVPDFYSHLQTYSKHQDVLIVMMYAFSISSGVLSPHQMGERQSETPLPYFSIHLTNLTSEHTHVRFAHTIWCLDHLLAFYVNQFVRFFPKIKKRLTNEHQICEMHTNERGQTKKQK